MVPSPVPAVLNRAQPVPTEPHQTATRAWHERCPYAQDRVLALSWRSVVAALLCLALVAGCEAVTPSGLTLQTPAPPTSRPIPSVTVGPSIGPTGSPPPAADWPTYLGNPMRTSASAEEILSTGSVGTLVTKLKVPTGDLIASSPAILAGIAYVGSADGNEYAIDLSSGAVRWKAFLGQTTNKACYPKTMGVTSSATVEGGVVYVGGGDAFWYALDAATGGVRWRVATGDNAATETGAHYNWSSPLIWHGAAYICIAGFCDNPSVQGGLLKVDLASHKVVARFEAVPKGTRGGGIWTSPTVDPASSTLFVVTGETTVEDQPLAQSMVALDAGTLKVRGSWRVPKSEAVAAGDSDWSTTPTLFNAGGRDLVAAGNKNGVLYAFLRSDIAAGPVWRRQLAKPGQCGVCAEGTFSSTAFDGTHLFAAGGATSIGGKDFKGGARSIDPATGAVNWEVGFDDPVLPAVTYDNGFVVIGDGPSLDILDAASGATLFTTPTGSGTYGAPSISGGRIVLGLLDGNLWALGSP